MTEPRAIVDRAAEEFEPSPDLLGRVLERVHRRQRVRRLAVILLAFAVAAAGAGVGAVAFLGGHHALPVGPRPNGSIAFAATGAEGAAPTRQAIFVVNPVGGTYRQLTGGTGLSDPSWSTDGRRIAVTTGIDRRLGGIAVMNADGTGFHQVTTSTSPIGQPSWSPDGTQIAFSRGNSLYAIDSDGSHLAPVVSYSGGLSQYPTWSPAGSLIAFGRSFAIPGPFVTGCPHIDSGVGIFVVHPDGSGLRRLTRGDCDSFPTWSPDGGRIAFVSWVGSGTWTISTVDSDGSHIRTVYTCSCGDGPSAISDLSWSPDGRDLAFVKDGSVYTMILAGGGVRVVPGLSRLRVTSLTWGVALSPAIGRKTSPPAPPVSVCTPGVVSQFLPPSPGDEDILRGLAAISSEEVWAVGAQFHGASADPGGQLALIERWDGGSWSIVQTPSTAPRNSVLASVSGTSPDDVWAVGRFEGTNDPTTGPEALLVEHWDGVRWSIVPSPVPPSHEPQSEIRVDGVTAVAPDDAWAVGTNDVLNTGPVATTPHTLIEHWDGRSWSIVPSPNVDDGSLLQTVSAVSPTDIWAVGSSYTGFGEISGSRALVEHWNGTAWKIVPGPAAPGLVPGSGTTATVVAIAANDVWVSWVRHLFRWDGVGWVSLPPPGQILALAARAPDEVWAGGGTLMHWDGTGWTTIPLSPKLPLGSTFNAAVLAPNGDVWAVGGLGYPVGHQHPFAVRRCAG